MSGIFPTMATAIGITSSIRVRDADFSTIKDLRVKTGLTVADIVGAGIDAFNQLAPTKREKIVQNRRAKSMGSDRRLQRSAR